jgi:hypothetical protein
MVKGIRILQVNKLYFPHIGGVEKVVQRGWQGWNATRPLAI